MTAVVTVDGVSKRYGDVVALEDVSFSLRENAIHGLLGRNGAGKTTLMQILTGQTLASAGRVDLFGGSPYENEAALSHVSFIKESQAYPNAFRVGHVLRTAADLFPHWDGDYARRLLGDLSVPTNRYVRKLSRGMKSALGVTIGLASRAPLTIFDEPYLGLDAVARQIFYDRLLADYAAHPRTVILSMHLIDEVGDLIERVLLLDGGHLVLDEDADVLRGQVVAATGPEKAVDAFAAGRTELHRERLGDLVRATIRGSFGGRERSLAEALGVAVDPLSLQQFMVSMTGRVSQ